MDRATTIAEAESSNGVEVRGPVLVVEDDAAVRRILRLVLEGAGFECLSCDDVEDALVIVRARKPKLVLVEVRLRAAGGQELARDLAHEGWRPRVALMSAYPRPPAGYEDYFLSKPIEFDRLLYLLDSIEHEPGW